jgi:NADPH2:quinone reductase
MASSDSETINRAVVVTAPGGAEVLQVQQLPKPEPGPGEVVVAVAAAGVNFIDVYKRQGVYPVPTPFVLGEEFAGHVVAVGSAVTQVEVGQLVATSDGHGALADFALAPADRVVPVPDGVDPQVAAAAMVQGMTAHYLTTSTYPINPGDEVLIHAAAGGAGQLLVQRAKARGAHVVATVGSAAKVALALGAGADVVLRYDEIDEPGELAAAVREASGGGVNVVYDGVGKSTFDASLASLRPRGMLVIFGGASGQVPPFDVQRLNSGGSLFVTRPTLMHYIADRAELLWRAEEVLGAVADGELRIAIGGRYPLAEAGQAYADLESRRSTGKLLILP